MDRGLLPARRHRRARQDHRLRRWERGTRTRCAKPRGPQHPVRGLPPRPPRGQPAGPQRQEPKTGRDSREPDRRGAAPRTLRAVPAAPRLNLLAAPTPVTGSQSAPPHVTASCCRRWAGRGRRSGEGAPGSPRPPPTWHPLGTRGATTQLGWGREGGARCREGAFFPNLRSEIPGVSPRA